MFNQTVPPTQRAWMLDVSDGSIFCSRDQNLPVIDLESQSVDFLIIGNSNEQLVSHLVGMGYNLVIFPKLITVIASDLEHINMIEGASAVLFPTDQLEPDEITLLKKLRKIPSVKDLPFIGVGALRNELPKEIFKLLDDFFKYPFETLGRFSRRVTFLRDLRQKRTFYEPTSEVNVRKMPLGKRLFDVCTSFALILLLSPVLALVALIIKLESKGPIFYIARRAGSGFSIFDFYKFRSMRIGADKEIKKLQHLNQYNQGNSAFFKVKDDPRITRIGKFLRNTSLDELPQLFNVLKGDMSMVGNRPLPLYEAEELTTDEFSKRFVGPAGITGLWQVSKRGRKEMSDSERINLDVSYSYQYGFWMDFKILLMTVPAMFQKESV